MPKQSVVMLYEDDTGWSFVILDPEQQMVYEDIVEGRLIQQLYEIFDVRLTITNSAFEAPKGITKFFTGNANTEVFCLHTSARALNFASQYLSQGMNKFMDLSAAPREPLRFENETWLTWLA